MDDRVKVDTGLDSATEENCTSIFRNIMHMRYEFNKIAEEIASSFDLRGSEMAVLDTLGRYGPITMKNLSSACFFSPPNTTYTVKSLEGKKLISRFRSTSSQREVIVKLTRNGEKIFVHSFPKAVNSVNAYLESKLKKREREQLQALLSKLAK